VISKLSDEGFGRTFKSKTAVTFTESSSGGSGKQFKFLFADIFLLKSFFDTRFPFIITGGLISFVRERYGSWQQVVDPA